MSKIVSQIFKGADSQTWKSADGWILLRATLSSRKALSEDLLKGIATAGKADDYEFGFMEQKGDKIKVIYRRKVEVPA